MESAHTLLHIKVSQDLVKLILVTNPVVVSSFLSSHTYQKKVECVNDSANQGHHIAGIDRIRIRIFSKICG